MRIMLIFALALCLAAPAIAGEATPASRFPPLAQPQSQPRPQLQTQPGPARDWDTLLQELRDLDSSQEMDGDHVVGEHLC